jgi:cytochrome c oxidase subunit 2
MMEKFLFLPQQASTFAWEVDAIYLFIAFVCFVFGAGVFAALVYFTIKYKRKSEDEIPEQIEGNTPLEIFWSVVPLGIAMVMFFWGALLFFKISTPPAEALNFYVVGKQWMWKTQHPSGKREINELHVPLGQPVKLTITSEDVLHSFYIPAFRTKIDAVPGRYTTSWFEPTRPGEYHIFCTEYCGLDHSRMIGRVVVLEPAQYVQWLKTGSVMTASLSSSDPPEVAGAKLFQEQRCNTCHQTNGTLGPMLTGIFGHQIKLQSGETIVADESYVRESIMNPIAKIVAGYQPIMPTYQGQLSEDQIMQLIAYIKSLSETTSGDHAQAELATGSEG